MEALKKTGNNRHFTEKSVEDPPYGPQEVRFTTNGEKLFVFVLNPSPGTIRIPSLGFNSPQKPGIINNISLPGIAMEIQYEQKANFLEVQIPKKRPTKYALVLEVLGAL